MRAAVSLVLLTGCSSLLGIEDPIARDAGPRTPDHLAFGLADFQLAQRQTVRLRVQLVFSDDTVEDATAAAAYSSDDDAIAAIGGPGVVNGGAQAGTATITARLDGAMPATVRATVTAGACHPVINELMAGGASAADEWVELYNPCMDAIDITGWTLDYRGAMVIAGPDSTFMILLAGQLPPGELRLFAGDGYPGASDGTWGQPAPNGIMGQNNGAVGLRAGPMTTGPLVDAVAYGTVTPGHPFLGSSAAPALSNGRSAARLPFDGKDGDDGAADFAIVASPTPRALNAP